jgi:hypothetical protein
VSQQERERFMVVLERLYANISELEGKPSDPGDHC